MKELTCSEVVWEYPIPDSYTNKFHISQRFDGPFAKDVIGGIGYYYLSMYKYDGERWNYVKGSVDTHKSFEEAFESMKKRHEHNQHSMANLW